MIEINIQKQIDKANEIMSQVKHEMLRLVFAAIDKDEFIEFMPSIQMTIHRGDEIRFATTDLNGSYVICVFHHKNGFRNVKISTMPEFLHIDDVMRMVERIKETFKYENN